MGSRNLVQRLSRVLILTLGLGFLLGCGASVTRRFPRDRAVVWQDDDAVPFRTECKPDPEEPGHRLCAPETYVSPFAWDALDNSMFLPLSRALAVEASREAVNVNGLDEVPDSSWFENRIGRRRLTPAEVAAGPCGDGKVLDPNGPAGSWLVDQGKPNGANPGFRVKVEGTGKFMLKADIASEPERATAATAIASRILWAAGFHTPCDSVVYLRPELLRLKEGLAFADNSGVSRPFDRAALDGVLGRAARRGELVRMSASRWLPGRAIGPFSYTGVRDDDPNDVVPHQHRRELRGLRLLSAWLNHFDSREQNTMNTWLSADPEDPDATPGHIKHWLLDFGDAFGSRWDWDPISRRLGHAHYLDLGYLAEDFVTLGAIERPWDRARLVREAPIFGYFRAKDFEPAAWRAGYPNPAFTEMTERDGAWAARIIARFTPEHLRALVQSGDLTSPEDAAYLQRTLASRRRAILRRYLGTLSPLADLRLQGAELCALDLASATGSFEPKSFRYSARGYGADPEAVNLRARAGRSGEPCVELSPAAARAGSDGYFVVDVWNGVAPHPLRVHLYAETRRDSASIAGLERPSSSDPPTL